jgi:hypothetical protein
MPSAVAAHRLDELLQASRVSLSRDRVTVELDLTPGAAIASAVTELVDLNADGAVSPIEAKEYGQVVLSGLVLELDGHPVALTLTRVETPSLDEMRAGVGTIALRAAGQVEAVAGGRRELYFQNNHHPAGSIYLVNALVSGDRDVTVLRQRRDSRQQAARIEYYVRSPRPARVLWLLIAAGGLSASIVLRRTANRSGLFSRDGTLRAA